MKMLAHTHTHRAAADLFKALAAPARRQILKLLKEHGGTLTVDDIASQVALEQPTVSHHLSVLYRAGLIDYEKDKLNRFYHLRPGRFSEARQILAQLSDS